MPRTALVTIVLAVLGGVIATQAAEAPPVQVRADNGRYAVAARFEVAAAPATVLRVLGDYEDIPRVLPRVTRSVITARDATHVVVEQTIVGRLLMFSKELHLVLDVRSADDTITFRDTSGISFRDYVGCWVVRASATGSVVTYELSATPAFDVPGVVLARLLRRDSAEMIDALRHTMEEDRQLGPTQP
jgi:hypothetical protein